MHQLEGAGVNKAGGAIKNLPAREKTLLFPGFQQKSEKVFWRKLKTIIFAIPKTLRHQRKRSGT